MRKKIKSIEEQDEIQEDTTSMEEKMEDLDGLALEEVSLGKLVAKDLVIATEMNSKDLEKQIDYVEQKIKLLGEFIKKHLKDGKDYGSIAFHAKNCPFKGNPTFSTKLSEQCKAPFCKMSKPFLQKPGSEKFVQLFNHRSKFLPIVEDFIKGIFAYKCILVDNKNEKVIGEGRGSALVSEKEKWTANEAMKIAEKRAQIDASLRVYGLSEHFTQDTEDIQTRNIVPISPISSSFATNSNKYSGNGQSYQNNRNTQNNGSFAPKNPNLPLSQPQLNKLFMQISKLGKTKEWLEKVIFDQTGVEGVENISMGTASKLIDTFEKKIQTMSTENLETITYDEEPRENIKRDTDLSTHEIEVNEEDWNNI